LPAEQSATRKLSPGPGRRQASALRQYYASRLAKLWGKVTSPAYASRPNCSIALGDTITFCSVLSANLCFNRGLPAGGGCTDSKEVLRRPVPFYASTRCHLMLQGTLRKNGQVNVPREPSARNPGCRREHCHQSRRTCSPLTSVAPGIS